MEWRRSGTRVRAATVAAVALAAAGCGGSQDAQVSAVAGDFYAALADKDGATACALLTPRTRSELEQSAQKPCATAILEEQIPRVRSAGQVNVFGSMAQVGHGDETAFLSRFPEGWLVVAAACTPTPSSVHDCQVKGG